MQLPRTGARSTGRAMSMTSRIWVCLVVSLWIISARGIEAAEGNMPKGFDDLSIGMGVKALEKSRTNLVTFPPNDSGVRNNEGTDYFSEQLASNTPFSMASYVFYHDELCIAGWVDLVKVVDIADARRKHLRNAIDRWGRSYERMVYYGSKTPLDFENPSPELVGPFPVLRWKRKNVEVSLRYGDAEHVRPPGVTEWWDVSVMVSGMDCIPAEQEKLFPPPELLLADPNVHGDLFKDVDAVTGSGP